MVASSSTPARHLVGSSAGRTIVGSAKGVFTAVGETVGCNVEEGGIGGTRSRLARIVIAATATTAMTIRWDWWEVLAGVCLERLDRFISNARWIGQAPLIHVG